MQRRRKRREAQQSEAARTDAPSKPRNGLEEASRAAPLMHGTNPKAAFEERTNGPNQGRKEEEGTKKTKMDRRSEAVSRRTRAKLRPCSALTHGRSPGQPSESESEVNGGEGGGGERKGSVQQRETPTTVEVDCRPGGRPRPLYFCLAAVEPLFLSVS